MVVAAVGATRPVGDVSVEVRDHLGQDLIVVERAWHPVVWPVPVGAIVYPLVLVVATPQRQARMRSQPTHLIAGFFSYLSHKLRRPFRISGTREHKVLPDEDAELIAKLVKGVVLVYSSPPHPKHIHVRVLRAREKALVAFVLKRAHKGVSRDPVGAPGKDRYTVKN
jgi:hypothetical protein